MRMYIYIYIYTYGEREREKDHSHEVNQVFLRHLGETFGLDVRRSSVSPLLRAGREAT